MSEKRNFPWLVVTLVAIGLMVLTYFATPYINEKRFTKEDVEVVEQELSTTSSEFEAYKAEINDKVEALLSTVYSLSPGQGDVNRYAIYDMKSGVLLYVTSTETLPENPDFRMLDDDELAIILKARFANELKKIEDAKLPPAAVDDSVPSVVNGETIITQTPQ